MNIYPMLFMKTYTTLKDGKEISRIYVELTGVSIHNKNTWQQTMEYLNNQMIQFETFWYEYEDFIKG